MAAPAASITDQVVAVRALAPTRCSGLTTRGVTAFQIAIAMGAISVLAKRQKLWLVSLALGAFGAAGLIVGLITT